MMLLSLKIALAFISVQDSGVLTLDQAVDLAISNAYSVKISREELERAKQSVRIAEGALGPSVGGQASYAYTKVHGGSSQSNAFLPTDAGAVALSVSQLIDISGEKRKLADAATWQSRAQEQAIRTEINALKGQIRNLYYAALQAEALVAVQSDALKANQERLDKAKIRFEQGAIPQFDVLRFESEVRKSQQDLLDAQTSVELAKQQLNSAMGRAIETEFGLQRVEGDPGVPGDASGLVRSALETRPELLQVMFSNKALEKTRESLQRSKLPSINLSANHTQNIRPSAFSPDSTTNVQAVLSIPLYTSGIIDARVKAARSDEEIGKLRFEQLQLAVALDVRAAYTRYVSARSKLGVAQSNEAVAREALRLADLRYDEGAGILNDVTTAQAELTAARAAVLTAIDEYLKAYAALQQAVGVDNLGSLAAPEQAPVATPE